MSPINCSHGRPQSVYSYDCKLMRLIWHLLDRQSFLFWRSHKRDVKLTQRRKIFDFHPPWTSKIAIDPPWKSCAGAIGFQPLQLPHTVYSYSRYVFVLSQYRSHDYIHCRPHKNMANAILKPPAIFALNRGQFSLPTDVIHIDTYIKIHSGKRKSVHGI